MCSRSEKRLQYKFENNIWVSRPREIILLMKAYGRCQI